MRNYVLFVVWVSFLIFVANFERLSWLFEKVLWINILRR